MENKVIRIIIVDIQADTVAILAEILFETHWGLLMILTSCSRQLDKLQLTMGL